MQGVVFMPNNPPQQGSPPPNSNPLVTDIMEVPSNPTAANHSQQSTKEKLNNTISANQSNSDSGFYSFSTAGASPTASDHHNNSPINTKIPSNKNSSELDTTTTNQTEDSSSSSSSRSDCSSPERRYVCPICDIMLTSQHDFTLHIRSHNNAEEENLDKHGGGGFTCRICQKVLSSSSSLDRHVLVHSGERPYNCKYCGDTFTTNGNMNRHMRTHASHNNASKSENYESDGSVDSSSSKSTEYNNNKIDSNSMKLSNNNNKRKLEEAVDLVSKKKLDSRQSPEQHEEQFYKCPVCDRTDFDSVVILETHLEDNHPDYPAKCNQCNQIFQNNKLLTVHRSNVHENSSAKLVTGFKDLTFVEFSCHKFPHIARYECERNIHKVSSGLKFQCTKCSRAFPCASSLEIHEKNCLDLEHNEGLDLTNNRSSLTDTEIRRNEFFSRLNLQNNSSEKSLVAPPTLPAVLPHNSQLTEQTSNKLKQQLLAKVQQANLDSTKDLADIQSIISMTTNGSLLQQLQTKDTPLPTTPNKTSVSNSISDLSKSSEQDEEPQDLLFAVEFRKMKLRGEFPCRLCTAIFPNLRALKGHNRHHLNNNNGGAYLCNMCPYSSLDKATLIRHMRTHNGDRPYECSLCNYAFTTKANCERHLRNRHGKTTRDEVKKNIIYHPSEDPTNEDMNKLALVSPRDELRKPSPALMHPVKPPPILDSDLMGRIPDFQRTLNRTPDQMPLIPEILKNTLIKDQVKQVFPSTINDIIRNENLKSLKDHHGFPNGQISPPLPHRPQFSFTPQPVNASTPLVKQTIHVKSLEVLNNSTHSYEEAQQSDSDHNDLDVEEEEDEEGEEEDDEEEEEPMALDLSKKKTESEPSLHHLPEDLSKKEPSPPESPQQAFPSTNTVVNHPLNMGEIFAQQMLKAPPKIDPAALYATQLAMCRNGFPNFPNWANFPLNPLVFQSLQNSAALLTAAPKDLKQNLQRYQFCGGNTISDNFAERLKALQNFHETTSNNAVLNSGFQQQFNQMHQPGSKPVQEDAKSDHDFSPVKTKVPIQNEDLKQPLNLNLNHPQSDSLPKIQTVSPQMKQTTPPDHHLSQHSPNSVKMVIKNGVLMPKQKQRRYRTERPFSCTHCSARFTLRSNMERHIKQQHPQFWSHRQRGVGAPPGPGRKSHMVHHLNKSNSYCDLSIPNYEIVPKIPNYDEICTANNTKENNVNASIDDKLKFAILAQHLRSTNHLNSNLNSNQSLEIKREEADEDGDLVIDENPTIKTESMSTTKTDQDIEDQRDDTKNRILDEQPLRDVHSKIVASNNIRMEENQDLSPISRLLDNASQQQFKEYFKREGEEQEAGAASEEDEEGLVASGSTSEGNVSGTDENRSESETAPPVKKKSAYSMAPNRVSCPHCSRKFPWHSSLRRHVLTHTGQKPFKCSHCTLLFTTKSNCDRHLLRKHGNSATTICNDLTNNNNNNNNNSNNNNNNQMNYLMRNVPERPFKCSNCPSSTFSTYSNLKKHISCKHSTNAQGDDIKAQGYEAGSSEDEKVVVSNHKRSDHHKNDHHHQSDRKTEWELQIGGHALGAKIQNPPTNTNNDLPQNSPQIPPVVVAASSASSAVNLMVQNSDLPFKCHLCEGSFSERQDALDHIKDRHCSEYDLLISKNALDTNAQVSTEEQNVHQDEDDQDLRGKFPDYSNRKVICAFCMRRFWSAEDLRRHMRTHTGERPFSCDICCRKFTLKHSMLRHRKKHNVNFGGEVVNSDEDVVGTVNNSGYGNDKSSKNGDNFPKSSAAGSGEKTEESDGNEGSDLISNLLGIRDRSFIDKVLTASADDAAKLLGVKNGVRE